MNKIRKDVLTFTLESLVISGLLKEDSFDSISVLSVFELECRTDPELKILWENCQNLSLGLIEFEV